MAQAVTFCRTTDNVNLAVGSVGQGPLLLKTANWLNHLEYDWVSPIWSPFYRRLSSRFRFVRYDGRGNGLSDRDVDDISFDGFVHDLEAVVATLPPQPFALLGLSQGAATAIAYAVRYPERVSRLILYGAYPQGRNKRGDPVDAAAAQTLLAMMQQGWGDERSPFMRAFSSIYLPNGTPEQVKWFADMQQATTTGALAARLRTACDDIDVVSLLPQVKVPTIVMHARNDKVASYEQGRMLAAGIPNATFITLESENHVPLPDEPIWDDFVRAIEEFAAA
jgi:pimeloyl-ACP methyl ester carboxylesterase